jgi:hypothetical protein
MSPRVIVKSGMWLNDKSLALGLLGCLGENYGLNLVLRLSDCLLPFGFGGDKKSADCLRERSGTPGMWTESAPSSCLGAALGGGGDHETATVAGEQRGENAGAGHSVSGEHCQWNSPAACCAPYRSVWELAPVPGHGPSSSTFAGSARKTPTSLQHDERGHMPALLIR